MRCRTREGTDESISKGSKTARSKAALKTRLFSRRSLLLRSALTDVAEAHVGVAWEHLCAACGCRNSFASKKRLRA